MLRLNLKKAEGLGCSRPFILQMRIMGLVLGVVFLEVEERPSETPGLPPLSGSFIRSTNRYALGTY